MAPAAAPALGLAPAAVGYFVTVVYLGSMIGTATAGGWNGVFLAEIARLAPRDRIGDATGGSAFFTFLGVVVTPPLFHLALHLTSSYNVAYALFGLPALAAGARLLLTAKIARDERYS